MNYIVSEEFLDALRELITYRWHLRGCEVDDSDFCTCGMRQALDEVNRLYKTDVKACPEPEEPKFPPNYMIAEGSSKMIPVE